MSTNLQQFIKKLERAGELIRIKKFVDPVLEISEITDRQCKSPGGGKALLFENTGTGYPVVTNIMGSERRICMALGVDKLEHLPERLDELFKNVTSPKKGVMDKLKMLPLLSQVSNWMPKSYSGKGDCQDIILKSLSEIPILKTWPHDADRFVTLPLVHTVDPHTGARNVGMYRMQVMGDLKTGMHWHRHKTGERHYEAYKNLGKRMPVTVCLGGDPTYTYAATAPLPDGIDEYLLAGFLRGKSVKMVKCLTNDIEVPADCDFVIEGYVDPTEEKVTEGAFGDHTGFYSLPDKYPVFHVTCITCKKNAIYPATIVGVPPMEDAWIAAATERIFLSPIKFAMMPELIDMSMPVEGVAHNIAICNIRKTYPGQGFKIGSAMWGAGQMMFNKFMVVLSDRDTIAERLPYFNPELDIMTSRGTLDVLDHASNSIGFGGKMCFDLTRKLPEEGERNKIDFRIIGEIPVNCRVLEQWHTIFCFVEPQTGVYESQTLTGNMQVTVCEPALSEDTQIATVKQELAEDAQGLGLAGDAQEVVSEQTLAGNTHTTANEPVIAGSSQIAAVKQALAAVQGAKAVIIFDAAAASLTNADLLWIAAGNTDAVRDISIENGAIIVDARAKLELGRDFPNIVTMDDKTIEAIDDKWSKLMPGALVESPSLKYKKLILSDSAEIQKKTK